MSERQFRLTRRRLFGGIVSVAAASAASGAGTMAYFTDTETSSDNTISAGTLKLDFDGSGTFEFNTALAPTQTTEESVTLIKNGSVNGSLDVDVSYKESDGDNNDPEEDVTADQVAENLEVVTLEYGGDTLLTEDQNLSGTPTLYDLENNEHGANESTQNDLINLDDPGTGGKVFTVGFRLKDVGNEFQSDGVSITFDFYLNQNDRQ
ncbi:SipW-cognate class signal peptide [Halomicrobium zhouii]|uniref:SipW-cognate class signal peptide n=1 Tax=Halomicrobium zhouii TaxID=767519 RepID=A0A1I6KPD8_9EURY|nr:TasA family protein [Halomicrobium zhouii]SFR93119.1 SipW-cognate class signal peptide [Halomicrobium zhouii]